MAWDRQQGYYQDPYQQYIQNQYGYDANYGYENYYDEPQEDTESQKLRIDQEEKERLEAQEVDRLYLKKIKKQCAKEDFSNLEKTRLFFFETMIESMEVNTESVLGLVADDNKVSVISGRVKFLNSPYMEICEKEVNTTEMSQTNVESEYIQSIGEAIQNSVQTTVQEPLSSEEMTGEDARDEEEKDELKITARWENSSGKSCLFSATPLMMVQDLDRHPVILQVVRSSVPEADEDPSCEPLGYAQLRLPEDFSLSVIRSCREGITLPISITHKATLDIKNVFGVKKGKVDIFVRLSSFGPAIITSFQTSGPDRKYVFKPSPMASALTESKEPELIPRSEVLKPILTEEETTYGITVQKEYDIFQKPVLWKETDVCGFKDGGSYSNLSCKQDFDICASKFDLEEGSMSSKYDCEENSGSLRLPLTSDISLCKNVLPPSVLRKLKFDNKICDWHNIVSAEIKNSPVEPCGCLDSWNKNKTSKNHSKDHKLSGCGCSSSSPLSKTYPPFTTSLSFERTTLSEELKKNPKKVSRVRKMLTVPPLDEDEFQKGFGMTKEPMDCGCDCPLIKEALKNKKLFII